MKKFSSLALLLIGALVIMVLAGCGKEETDLSIKPTEEEQTVITSLAGTWEANTPNEDGTTTAVKVEIDDSQGFTFTTGTINPDGTASYYSRVGSYDFDKANSTITFMATSGGESTDGVNYQLQQSMGSFPYTYQMSEDGASITLTPSNDSSIQLTSANPITLTKAQ